MMDSHSEKFYWWILGILVTLIMSIVSWNVTTSLSHIQKIDDRLSELYYSQLRKEAAQSERLVSIEERMKQMAEILNSMGGWHIDAKSKTER